MKKEENIDSVLIQLQELIDAQEASLIITEGLCSLKDCMIDILEEKEKIYTKENKILKICLYSLIALDIIQLIISLL